MADARDFENIFLQMNKIFHKLCGIYFMFNDFIYIYILFIKFLYDKMVCLFRFQSIVYNIFGNGNYFFNVKKKWSNIFCQ